MTTTTLPSWKGIIFGSIIEHLQAENPDSSSMHLFLHANKQTSDLVWASKTDRDTGIQLPITSSNKGSPNQSLRIHRMFVRCSGGYVSGSGSGPGSGPGLGLRSNGRSTKY
jgi:hypothetical protein